MGRLLAYSIAVGLAGLVIGFIAGQGFNRKEYGSRIDELLEDLEGLEAENEQLKDRIEEQYMNVDSPMDSHGYRRSGVREYSDDDEDEGYEEDEEEGPQDDDPDLEPYITTYDSIEERFPYAEVELFGYYTEDEVFVDEEDIPLEDPVYFLGKVGSEYIRVAKDDVVIIYNPVLVTVYEVTISHGASFREAVLCEPSSD